ncbi:MAG: glycerol-3-phosphate 1-O-acyltransferase PlsY [Chloroflexota bacterium]
MQWPATLALVGILGYLLGSIPTGAIVGRARGVDLRAVGSGSTGATNALRSLGWPAALAVFAGDIAKGSLAVLVARLIAGEDAWASVIAASTAVVGHGYSPWIGWRGGKGVATAIGGLIVISPTAFIAAFVAGFILIAVTRYVSLGSIVGTVLAGMIVLALSGPQSLAYVAYAVCLPTFILISHRTNIARLLNGTERKLGERLAAPASPGA